MISNRKFLNQIRKIHTLMVQMAIEKASTESNDHLLVLWKNLDPKRLSDSDIDCLNNYLFSGRPMWCDFSGKEPKFVPKNP